MVFNEALKPYIILSIGKSGSSWLHNLLDREPCVVDATRKVEV